MHKAIDAPSANLSARHIIGCCGTAISFPPAGVGLQEVIVAVRPRSKLERMKPPALTDSTATLAELKARVLAFAREREWEQFHAPKNLSMALAAEAGELMEHFLWARPEDSRALAVSKAKRAAIADELADVVIYALEFANVTGIDVAAAITTKMKANAKKYPVEKARGRSAKYTEL